MLTFSLNNIGGVGAGSQAEAGFTAAAALWSSYLSDSVNIRLDVGFSSLGVGILGQTGSTSKVVSYSSVRTALTSDQTSVADATAVASLAAGPGISFYTNNTSGLRVFDNNGSGNNQFLNVNTANLKALGITVDANGQQVDNGVTSDASIRFNSNFSFDFDPNNGIAAGAIDFVGVAFHEIGHALGFVSGVDVVDVYSGFGPEAPLDLNPYAVFSTLDLFRYSSSGVRDLSFGGATYFSVDGGSANLGLFSTGQFNGDGRQASHWKDNLGLGIMDPTAAPAGQASAITSLDIQAMDAIGWNLSSAEPDGFSTPTFELASFGPGAGGWSSDNLYKRELADVNGDGRADIVGFGSSGVYVSLATNNGHFASPTFELASFGPNAGGWSSDNLYKRELADVNGDGRADIVGFGSSGVYVSLATNNGHFASPTFELASFGPGSGGWSSDDLYKRELADVNGDGRADIVGFGSSGVYVSLATNNGHFASPTFELASFGPGSGGWSSDNLYKRELADVDGDGRADIVGFAHLGVYVSHSEFLL